MSLLEQINSSEDEREVKVLRERLNQVRRRRALVKHYKDELEQHSVIALHQLDQSRLQREETVQEYKSILSARKCQTVYLQHAQRWNVTNDCLHVWHNGPFATINGMRLGSEVPPLPFEGSSNLSSKTLDSSSQMKCLGPQSRS